METTLKGSGTEITIGRGRPTVVIGEGISPSEGSQLADALRRLDTTLAAKLASAQVLAGADVVAINLGAAGLDEKKILPLVVRAVAEAVPVPICISTNDSEALAAALDVCPGKPLVGSVTGEERSLKTIVPLAKRRGAAVIGMALGEEGVRRGIGNRVEMARDVLRQCISMGMPRQDIILDPLPPIEEHDLEAVRTALDAATRLAKVEDINIVVRASSLSLGLPQQDAIVEIFTALALAAGATCTIIDPLKGRSAVHITDLLLGRDSLSKRYT